VSTRSKEYWEKRQHRYPYQVKVPHMSPQDMDPREFARVTGRQFLRVPFDGIAHWGFTSEMSLDKFILLSNSKLARQVM